MDKRIKELRKALGLTQQKFADGMGVKQNTIAQYESGRNTPIDAVIALICRTYGVNETWLRTGVGSMFVAKTQDEELAAFFGDVLSGQPDFKRRLLSALSRLDDAGWSVLEQLVDSMLDEAQKEKADP